MFSKRNFLQCACVTLSLPFCVAQQARPQGSLPRFVDFTLAGTRLSLSQKEFHKFDRKAGYHLLGENKFNHGYVSLALMRDPEGGAQGARRVKLPSLSSGRGVIIGATPQQVRAKLGAPTKTFKDIDMDDDGRNDLIYDYTTVISMAWPGSKRTVNRVYSGTYIFSKNRLRQISYLLKDSTDEPNQ